MKNLPVIAYGIIIAVIFGGILSGAIYVNTITGTSESCVVTGKDRTQDSEGNSQARVYTENCGTLKVADSIVDGQWNSADVYGGIQEGNTYDFNTRGVRIPFLSAFPNIIKVTEVSK